MKIELSDKYRLIAGLASIVAMIASFKLLKGSDLSMVINACLGLFNLALNTNVQKPTDEKVEEKKQ